MIAIAAKESGLDEEFISNMNTPFAMLIFGTYLANTDLKNMFTEKFGTHQCTLAVRESMMRTHHVNIDDAIITDILRTGTASINEKYLETIISTVKEYTKGIFLCAEGKIK